MLEELGLFLKKLDEYATIYIDLPVLIVAPALLSSRRSPIALTMMRGFMTLYVMV